MIQRFKTNKFETFRIDNLGYSSNREHKFKITINNGLSGNHINQKNKDAFTLLLIISVFLVLNFPITINKTISFFGSNSSTHEGTNLTVRHEMNHTNYSEISFTYNNTLKTFNQIENLINPDLRSNQIKEIFSKIASYIYYINYSINFFLYTFRTKQFRENIFKMFRV